MAKIGIAYNDGRYFQFKVLRGSKGCKQIETENLIGGSYGLELSTVNNDKNGEIVSVKTDKSLMYLWPGWKNELFLTFIIFLIITTAALYVDGMKKLFCKY